MERSTFGELDSAYRKHKKCEVMGHFVRTLNQLTGLHSYHYASLNESTKNMNSALVDNEKGNFYKPNITISKENMPGVNAEIPISCNLKNVSETTHKLSSAQRKCTEKSKQRISRILNRFRKSVQEGDLSNANPLVNDGRLPAYNLNRISGSCETSQNIAPWIAETGIRFNRNYSLRSKVHGISTHANVPVNANTQIADYSLDAPSSELGIHLANINTPMHGNKGNAHFPHGPPKSKRKSSPVSNYPVDEESRTSFNLNDLQKCGSEKISTTMHSSVNKKRHVSNNPTCISRGACEVTSASNLSAVHEEMQASNNINCISRSLLETIPDHGVSKCADDQCHRIKNRSSRCKEAKQIKLSMNVETPTISKPSFIENQPSDNAPLEIETTNPLNFNIDPRSRLETTSRYQPGETYDQNSTHLSTENQHKVTVDHAMETEMQNSTKPNWSPECHHKTNSTDLPMEPEEQSLLNLDMDTKIPHETLNEAKRLDDVRIRVEFNFSFTSETEQYNYVMAYLRDTHDICCSYASNFVDVLHDMVTVITGCQSEFIKLKSLLPNADNIQESLFSYLEIVKVLCKNLFENVTLTDSIMNSCLNQQRVLNKICAGMAYSPIPLSISVDTLEIINRLCYDLFSVNNSIQKNVERVQTFHIYKEQIVYIMRRIRQICNQSNF